MLSKMHYEGYSFALLELARTNKKVNEFKIQAEKLIYFFKKYPLYIKLLNSYEINFSEKEKLLEKAFGNELDIIIYRLIFILIQKNKVNGIINILNSYVHQINKVNECYNGIIYSKIKLTSKEIKDIQNTTAKKLNQDITLTNEIDEKIIAGFKIIINDIVIDDTITNHLRMMKKHIIKNNN